MLQYNRAYDNGQSSDIFWRMSTKSNLARQIFYTLSVEILWSLQNKLKRPENFSPYHKHCYNDLITGVGSSI